MTKPQRLTRSRKRGSKMPENAIYVGRPTLWGNPFSIDHFGHAKCVILHASWLNGQIGDLMMEQLAFCPKEIETLHRKRTLTLQRLHRLAGHDLVCWCPQSSAWCHATTLIDMPQDYAEIERMVA